MCSGTYDSAGSGSGRSREGSLGVFNSESQFGLGTLVTGGGVLSTWHV